MEFSLGGAALLAIAAVYLVIQWEAARGNAADPPRDLWDVAIGSATVGLFVGRLAAMVIAGTNPLAHPGDILILRSGVDTGWAAMGALVTMALLARRETVLVADGLAPSALAGLGAWEAGCLVRDTCHGTVTSLPWGISLSGSGVTRHPVGLYTALLFLGAALLISSRKQRSTNPLGTAGMALAAAGSIRWGTEFMRPALGTPPVGWYLAAVVAGMVMIAVASYRRRCPAG